MKNRFPLLLTLALISNYSYSATYSAYVPLEGNISKQVEQKPEENLPVVSSIVEFSVFDGKINSGSHPYINSVTFSKTDNNYFTYTVQSRAILHFSYLDARDISGNNLSFDLSDNGCTLSGSIYNCVFKINSIFSSDSAGTSLEELYKDIYEPYYFSLEISN